MNKEKEIEEMVDELSIELTEGMKDGSFWDFMYGVVEKMIGERGYRKADEVRKETAKEIYERVEKWLDETVPHTREETLLICLLGWIKTKYDVYNDFDEVDE